jgi:hypothetical protein
MPSNFRNPKSESRKPKGIYARCLKAWRPRFSISDFGLGHQARRQNPRSRRLVRALSLERLEDRTLL